MIDVSAPDIGIRFAPPLVEAPKPIQNFTPLPESKRPTTTEPPQYQEPTATPEMDRLMSDILAQGGVKKPQEIVKQVQSAPVEVKKSQGFWAKILDWFRNFFK